MHPCQLHVLATPIGNMADASPHLREVLASLQVLACEDTRRAGKLCMLLGIKTPKLVKLNKDNETASSTHVLTLIQQGQRVGLVSDGGLPGISDPGATLITMARQQGVAVTVVGGPSAPSMVVAGSGMAGPFVFTGFLPRKGKERTQALTRLGNYPENIVLFEAPTRITQTVQDLHQAWGNRPAWLARELTKLHEEWLGPDLQSIHQALVAKASILGEITLIVTGNTTPTTATTTSLSWQTQAQSMLTQGLSKRDISTQLATQHGIAKKIIYAHLLTLP